MKALIITVIAFLLLGGAGYFFLTQDSTGSSNTNNPTNAGTTEVQAFMSDEQIKNIFQQYMRSDGCNPSIGTGDTCVLDGVNALGYQTVNDFNVVNVSPGKYDSEHIVEYSATLEDPSAQTLTVTGDIIFQRMGTEWDYEWNTIVFDNLN